jgi:hypothetical protein
MQLTVQENKYSNQDFIKKLLQRCCSVRKLCSKVKIKEIVFVPIKHFIPSNGRTYIHAKTQAGMRLIYAGCTKYLNVSLNKIWFAGFEVLTAAGIKNVSFWDITPYFPLTANRDSEEHVASVFKVEDKVELTP